MHKCKCVSAVQNLHKKKNEQKRGKNNVRCHLSAEVSASTAGRRIALHTAEWITKEECIIFSFSSFFRLHLFLHAPGRGALTVITTQRSNPKPPGRARNQPLRVGFGGGPSNQIIRQIVGVVVVVVVGRRKPTLILKSVAVAAAGGERRPHK